MRILIPHAVGALALSLSFSPAFSSAPVGLEPVALPSEQTRQYQLDTEFTVHNWVLCVSRATAERMARAQEESVESAARAYDELAGAKSCGRFAALGVRLTKQLYPEIAIGEGSRVFEAAVNLGGGWRNAFVVSVSGDEAH